MSKTRFIILFLSMAWIFAGCGVLDDTEYYDGGTCAPPEEFQVESDRFALSHNNAYPNDFDKFAAKNASVLKIDVDRGASRVTVTYMLDGKTVVERYKISASQMH